MQNHRITELQNHRRARVERDLKDHESPTSLPHAGPPTSTFDTRPGGPGPHPGMGYPQPLWAAWSSIKFGRLLALHVTGELEIHDP